MPRNENEQLIYESGKELIRKLPPGRLRTSLILDVCRAEHPGLLGSEREGAALDHVIAAAESLS